MAKPIAPTPANSTSEHTADTRNPDWDKYVPDGDGRTDEQIRADVHEALSAQGGAESGALSIDVKDGLVTLGGVGEGSARTELIERIRALPSVRDVRYESAKPG